MLEWVMFPFSKERVMLVVKAAFKGRDRVPYTNRNPRKNQFGILKVNMSPPNFKSLDSFKNPNITGGKQTRQEYFLATIDLYVLHN
jgi:hypothetical protein